jgi:hypothetical protein
MTNKGEEPMVESSSTPVSPISGGNPGKSPRQAVEGFLKYTVDTPNLEKAKLHLTKRSVASGSLDAAAVPPGSTYTLGAEEADELGRRIPVSVRSPGDGGAAQEMTVQVIVIEEEGDWKIDLPATLDRMMGGAMNAMGQMMGDALGAVGQAMSTAMTGVTQALATGMGDPSPGEAIATRTRALATKARSAGSAAASQLKRAAKTAAPKAKKLLKKAVRAGKRLAKSAAKPAKPSRGKSKAPKKQARKGKPAPKAKPAAKRIAKKKRR